MESMAGCDSAIDEYGLKSEIPFRYSEKSKRLKELFLNPQIGIKYEKIRNKGYEMKLFDDSDFEIVVFKNEKKIYFVAETKSAGQELRESEKMKKK